MALAVPIIVLLVPVYLGGVIVGQVLQLEVINKLNAVLATDERFEHFGWWLGKHLRFRDAYREHFPRDTLKYRAIASTLIGNVAFLAIIALSVSAA